jgi:50S ribosomal protein L16 3-hydroxylase
MTKSPGAAQQLHIFDSAAFLRDYWQKKPLLIRNPWGQWHNPLEPDELAGLACEEYVESRLIEKLSSEWLAESGPFSEKRFEKLVRNPWTLLVQAVDQYVPDVAALIEPFRFIPNWRIDDVMVSYANNGGGVGAHFDQYDVFLIQGLGKRRWQIGQLCDDATPLLPDDNLRLLAEFNVQQEWVLEPGDILYLPPRIAHNGVAVGDDCMTYSIGFRAPSRAELISHFTDDILDNLDDDDRYSDPAIKLQNNPGEIGAGAIDAMHNMLISKLSDRASFARWFGKYNSTPKYPDMDWTPDQAISQNELLRKLSGGEMMLRNPASRFSFIRDSNMVQLFVDGICHDCGEDTCKFAETICAQTEFMVLPDQLVSGNVTALITALYNQGSIAFADDV